MKKKFPASPRVRPPKGTTARQTQRRSAENRGRDKGTAPKAENLVFGVMPVEEILRSGSRRVERVLLAEGGSERRVSSIIELARAAGIRFDRVPREDLNRVAGHDSNHQGVVAFVAAAEYADAESVLDKLVGMDSPLVLLLDGIEDPRNLGALIRVAECAGVDAVFLPEHRAVGLTETVVKTAAGAVEHVDTAKVKNLNRLIERLKEMGIWVVGTAGESDLEYTDWDWTRPSAVVMGGEGAGLHRLVAENCDALVRIPMQGNISSLNVSVAAGVVLFEAVRQRREKGSD